MCVRVHIFIDIYVVWVYASVLDWGQPTRGYAYKWCYTLTYYIIHAYVRVMIDPDDAVLIAIVLVVVG